ncbi:hypothetical protein [Bradyrhizobium sp. sBnM-33]|uniref:hypothetical protein n=1 Tax=Bradyrhizobium sp. sBnM-33 TaxID=2831780 RepID=UPI001BD1B435|nr:hypothetical protein [Bradyrhizobium sp. sBnM-33]WOH53826.1 hypothetical protein RX328_18080 [Bradyrhizobium sp. sBnM-33]
MPKLSIACTYSFVSGCLLALVIAALWSCQANAQPNYSSGNYLLKHCKNSITTNNPGVWDGFCGGIIGTLLHIGESLPI